MKCVDHGLVEVVFRNGERLCPECAGILMNETNKSNADLGELRDVYELQRQHLLLIEQMLSEVKLVCGDTMSAVSASSDLYQRFENGCKLLFEIAKKITERERRG